MKCSGASLIIILCICMHMTSLGTNIFLYHTTISENSTIYFSTQAIAYLIYPILGWLADIYFTRYKFVRCSFILMITGTVLVMISGGLAAISLQIPQLKHQRLFYLIPGGLSLITCLVSLGMFESTAIQFGMDQMHEASSDKLSAYIHWYYWSSKLGRLFFGALATGILVYFSMCHMQIDEHTELLQQQDKYNMWIVLSWLVVMVIVQFISAVIGICMLTRFKQRLIIDRTGDNPWKLVYKVLKYSWKHTCPERRSAFTYWEEDIPPRIDIGKEKYGGPFTTEEVEDTKTLFRILLLLISLFGFQLSGDGYSILNQLMRGRCPPYLMTMIADPTIIAVVIMLLYIPVYQWVMLPLLHNYVPNILKRIGLGMLCCTIKHVIEITLKLVFKQTECSSGDPNPGVVCYYLNSQINTGDNCSHYNTDHILYNYSNCSTENNGYFAWLLIPEMLNGLCYVLVFMTVLEFICAQAPLRMKGMLIGVWYASLAFKYLFVQIPESYVFNSTVWDIYQVVKAFLILVSLVLYCCVSKKYRYRLRDEVVNVQYLVEEVYDRELEMADKYRKQQTVHRKHLGVSVSPFENKPLLITISSHSNSYCSM